MDGGCLNYSIIHLWKFKLYLKVHYFLWLVLQNKIFTTDNLCRKGWVGTLFCAFCSVNETINHLFLTCPFMLDFCFAFNEYNSRNVNLNLSFISDLWDPTMQLSGLDLHCALSIITVVCWVRWNERNRVIFSHLGALSFNVFILKVTNFFNAWACTTSSLEQLCRDESIMTFTED
jgi:zinc-binding in reverse transcriptase